MEAVLTTETNYNDMNTNNSNLHRIKLCPEIIKGILYFSSNTELDRLKQINFGTAQELIIAEIQRRQQQHSTTAATSNVLKTHEQQNSSQKPNQF